MFDTALIPPELFRNILNNKIGRLRFPENAKYGESIRLFEYLPEVDRLSFNILYCNITRQNQASNKCIIDVSVRSANLQISEPPSYVNPNAIQDNNVTYELVFSADNYFH